MATHWRRQHTQLTDLMPDRYHQWHLNSAQYNCLTQNQEATGCHYHVQRPAWIPVVFDGNRVWCEGVKLAYSYGFPCRGFGMQINPMGRTDIRPDTEPDIPHGRLYNGWNALWARRNALLFAIVMRVGRWLDDRSFTCGEHDDFNTPMNYDDYGVDLDRINAARPFAFLFGNGVHHFTRVNRVQRDFSGTIVELTDPIPTVPPIGGQWVYLSPVDMRDDKFLTASYAMSVWVKSDTLAPMEARTLGVGEYSYVMNFFLSSTDDWADPRMVGILPPTTVSFDLAAISVRYTLALGVYKTYRDERSLIKSLAFYRSSTRLPDGDNRTCGVLPDVVVRYDERSEPHVYLWCTRRATLRVVKVKEL